MDTTIFLELDEKFQNTDMALDELLRMKLPTEAKDAIGMVVENLRSALSMIAVLKEDHNNLIMTNQKLMQVVKEAKKQLKEIDIEMDM